MFPNRLRLFTLCAAVAAAPLAASSQQPSSPDSSASGTNSGSTTHSAKGSPDKRFLRKASEGGYAEVQLGQLAAQKGSSDDVKKFGQKMVDDHTALNDQLKPFAESMGVSPATKLSPKDQAEYDKLNGLSGDDFDKEYLAYMSKDHHKDMHEFRKEEATASDPALKDAVTKGLGVIKEHTVMVDKLAKDKGVSTASHHAEASSPATK